MTKGFLLLLVFSFPFHTMGQEKKDRYRFAQTYVGLQADWLWARQQRATSHLIAPNFGAGRILLGGLHFWGKADFYLSFPIQTRSLGSKDWQYSEGVITGGRILPFGPGKKLPFPYFGIQWATPGFIYKDGSFKGSNSLSIEAGAMKVVRGKWSVEGSVHHVFGQRKDYFVSRTENANVQLPGWGASIALKRHIDFTAANSQEAVVKYLKKVRENMSEKGGLNSFSLAIGPSVTIGLKDIPYALVFPWVNQKTETTIHPDFGIGYYLHHPDMGFRLSYRPVSLYQSGHGLSIRHRHQRFSLEVLKFLFDYHGFAPYIGLAGGIVHYSFVVTDNEVIVTEKSQWLPSYAFVFGWDIRPTDVEWFILRTNFRYLPDPGFQVQSLLASSPQLEVNFIQFIFYPQRFKRHLQTQKS